MEHITRVVCPVCHITIAPFDPERVQKELSVYHLRCLRQKEAKEEQERLRIQRLFNQLHYGRA